MSNDLHKLLSRTTLYSDYFIYVCVFSFLIQGMSVCVPPSNRLLELHFFFPVVGERTQLGKPLWIASLEDS